MDHSTSMEIVLTNMARADAEACFEFARRQARDTLAGLRDAGRLINDTAHHLITLRPDQLMAWKFPEHYTPIPNGVIQPALEAAFTGDKNTLWPILEPLAFRDLITSASIGSQIEHATAYLLKHNYTYKAPDPQGSLF